MMKTNVIIILFSLVLLTAACSLLQETDISNEVVFLNAPYDSMQTSILTTSFWWEYVNDANAYNLKVVTPSFDSIIQLVLDTNLTENKFIYTLNPGKYEWAVYAFNSEYSTNQYIRSFRIDSTEGVSGQFVNLVSPSFNFCTNNTQIVFNWNILPMEASYILSIRDSSFSEDGKVFQNSYESGPVTVELPEGKYMWGVMAYQDLSSSAYSKRYLIVDTTAPGQAIITNPSSDYDTLKTSPYTIQWERKGSSLSEISNIIWIHNDTITNQHKEFSVKYNEFSLSSANLSEGKYVIQIKSVDAAGNTGILSEPRILYLKKE